MAKSRLQQYLWRIGFEGQLIPTLVTLDALQRRHALNVPFENLDVQLGRTLTTDADTAFDKIVLDRRGGWCYEQNGLFGWALGEIGFEVPRRCGFRRQPASSHRTRSIRNDTAAVPVGYAQTG
jgi:N-hydroxyarylamine O-acetyltransferase